uniref:Alpha/beta hydrolase fold-3 domain-containing protein n=1 Tax=Ciona savignyi TaxID=51511 RepID=H2YW22_CIOSA
MGFMKRAVVVTSAVTVLLAVLIHRRIPDNVPHRNTIQLFVNYVSFIELLASITEKIGYSRWWPYRLSGSPPQPPKGMKVEHRYFAGVDCVVITPRSFQERSEPGPAIVFYHGGGFAFGDLAIYRNILTDMAEETGFLVMSPAYRVAPEHPFPTPYHDCINSTISFMRSTDQLNVNPKKVILAGDSAGGNLAMAVYIGLLQMNDPTLQLPAMQVLIYPMLQMINFQTPSYSHGDLMFSNNLAPKFLLAYI